jgi:spore photoproduct lyase
MNPDTNYLYRDYGFSVERLNMLLSERSSITTETLKGDFWKPCPGTCGGYFCCGYQIITPLRGCGMYCRYCVLQVYFERQCQVQFENYRDLEIEVARKMEEWKGVVRFGTGEFGDSLWAEDHLGLSSRIAATLEPYRNASVDSLHGIHRPERIIVGFSLNTPRMIERFEQDTASLDDRFKAAQKCEAMGFHVAFHFDPMFWYDGWEQEYREVVRSIYRTVLDPSKIAWVSLGGFRSNPQLKRALKEKGEHLPLYSGEMIVGADGKLRYFRPYRVAFYTAMQDEFEKHDPGVTLYLCMESKEVWEASGMMKRIPRGLPEYLDKRAERMLGRVG